MTQTVEEVVVDGLVWVVERFIDKSGNVVTENSYPKERA